MSKPDPVDTEVVTKTVRRWMSAFGAPPQAYDDLIQVGWEVLLRYKPRYDPAKASYATYMINCIRGGLNTYAQSVRSHVSGSSTRRRYGAWVRREAAKGEVDLAKMREKFGLRRTSDRDLCHMVHWLTTPELWVDAPGPDGERTILETLAAPDAPEGEPIGPGFIVEVMRECEGLERIVLLERIMPDGDGLTLNEIGERHGYTREGVRKVEKRVIARIRRIARRYPDIMELGRPSERAAARRVR